MATDMDMDMDMGKNAIRNEKDFQGKCTRTSI